MNGMMVTVPTNVAHEPRAPRIPNFLFQSPRNKSAPNSHSETPVEVAAPAGSFKLIATHFGLNLKERRAQARALVAIARRHPRTTVMLGDFNEWFWPASLRGALGRELPARTQHATFPSWYPLLRLDRIFCWPPDAMRGSFVGVRAWDPRFPREEVRVTPFRRAAPRGLDQARIQFPESYKVCAGMLNYVNDGSAVRIRTGGCGGDWRSLDQKNRRDCPPSLMRSRLRCRPTSQ